MNTEQPQSPARNEVTLILQAEKHLQHTPSRLARFNDVVSVAILALKASILLFVLSFLVLNHDLLRELVRAIKHLEVPGIKLDIELSTQQVVKARPNTNPENVRGAVLRSTQAANVYSRASILWVDEQPENNAAIRQLLKNLNAQVTLALTTKEAREAIDHSLFDVMITNLHRDEGKDQAEDERIAHDFIDEVAKRRDAPYIIVYTGNKNDYVGTTAFAATHFPDDLLDYLTDVLERRAAYIPPNKAVNRSVD
jgi:CheY-like chemotaxis protein